MSVIRLVGFRGEYPRIHPRFLPTGAAQQAINCRSDAIALEALRDSLTYQATVLTNPISLFRYSASIWLESVTDTDWVPYPVVDDQYGRVIYADPAASELRVTDASLVGTGGAPASYYKLEVPAPEQGFSATLVGTADDAEEVPETRYYVCTFVNSWGAEGPPSPPSNQVEWRTGQTVQLDGLPAVPTGAYNIAYRRIYRINTGSSGTTNYQFVSEVATSQAQKSVSNITQANPVVVTTSTAHNLSDGQEVEFSGLGLAAAQALTSPGISKTNPATVFCTNHGYSTGDWVEFDGLGGANGMDELQGVRAQITVANSGSFTLNGIDATAYTTWVSGGTVAKAFGMDELDGNQYFVSVLDLTSFSLISVDGTAFNAYHSGGTVWQVAGTSYTDSVPSESLAEVLPTENYDPPNANTIGIKTHPSGFLVGFFGKTVAFSEPGAPHAWPIDYQLSTSHDIVGIGIFGNTVAIVTKGWPYLAVGSDPSAMTMIELEIDQACASKSGIVDFGSAIAYPSPDGLIVLSGSGATNAASGVFRREQWQALNPASFVAFNWEQKYLCFYDNGTTQRGFILDPFDPDAGVRYVEKHVTGGYKDLEEDLLYLILGANIVKWDEGANLSYTWKSAPMHIPQATNMAAAKVHADAFPVVLDFYVDDVKRHSRVVGSEVAFRLPGGFKGTKFEVVATGKNRVSQITLATTMVELASTP